MLVKNIIWKCSLLIIIIIFENRVNCPEMPSFWDKVSYEYSVKSYSTRWNKLQPPVLHTLEAPASEHLQLPLNADHSLKIELLVWTGTHTPSVICGAGFHFFHFLRSVLWLFVWPDPKWVIVITGMGFTTRQFL